MGDISEVRGIVVIGSFIGCLVLLLATIPVQLFATTYEGSTIEIPEYFEATDLAKYATTWNYTFDGTDATAFNKYYALDIEIGGYSFEIDYAKPNLTLGWIIEIWHETFWWIFKTGSHEMYWYKEGVNLGDILTETRINSDYNNGMGDITYLVKCEHTQLDLFFAFNETKYSFPSEAFNNQELTMMIGVEWDQVSTSMSAWDIIGMLLFFQLPDVHWFINAIIAIPIWLGIAYISYILILRTIGAIFGGGA